jgi:hypothetical protein
MKRYALPVLAYLIPTFALGFVWHLMLFESYYTDLQIYREDIIVPFGFVSMLIQAVIFAYIFDRCFAGSAEGWLKRGAALCGARCLAFLELHNHRRRGEERDDLRPGLSGHRNCIHCRAVVYGRSADGARFRNDARDKAGAVIAPKWTKPTLIRAASKKSAFLINRIKDSRSFFCPSMLAPPA